VEKVVTCPSAPVKEAQNKSWRQCSPRAATRTCYHAMRRGWDSMVLIEAVVSRRRYRTKERAEEQPSPPKLPAIHPRVHMDDPRGCQARSR